MLHCDPFGQVNLGCNPARPLQPKLQESPGPRGPGIPKESQKSLSGPSALGSRKCPKQSRNSLRSLKIDCFKTPEIVSRLFRTLFGLGAGRLSDSGFRALWARGTPVRGGRGSERYAKQLLAYVDLRLALRGCTHEKGHWEDRGEAIAARDGKASSSAPFLTHASQSLCTSLPLGTKGYLPNLYSSQITCR